MFGFVVPEDELETSLSFVVSEQLVKESKLLVEIGGLWLIYFQIKI